MNATVSEIKQGNLDVNFGRSPVPRDPEAWKRMMGTKPVPARLATLPENKVSWRALASSSLFQIAAAGFLVALPIFFPQRMVTKIAYVVTPITAPDTSVPLPSKKPLPPPPKVQQPPPPEPVVQPEPTHIPKLVAPRNLVAPKPKPLPIQAHNEEAPKVEQPLLEAKFEAPAVDNQPARPREPVKVGGLSSGSAAPATVKAPIEKVQTGGFGDPDGLQGPSNPNKRANIDHYGAPVLPPGPGYGNGTGGATGIRGTVASAGFGNGVAVAPQSNSAPRAQVQSGGFATAASTADAPKAKQDNNSQAAVQPVVIEFKPNPVYTQEARNLKIEGEVLVEVVFRASGNVQVSHVVKGLGHGLDEAAIRAAEQIRFKPALQNGAAVDFPATVHIVFQLAF